MDSLQLLRLQRIEVDGLFGIYDHHIDLNLKDRVTLLHGSNGVGKTTVLRMVDGLLRQKLTYFRRIPFARLLLAFQGDSVLELTNKEGTTELKLTKPKGRPRSSRINLGPTEAESIAAKTDYLQPYSSVPAAWIDLRYDEVLSESEVISRYGAPTTRRKSIQEHDIPWLKDFLNRANTYLIEAQRLVRTPWDLNSPDDFQFRRRRRSIPFISRVSECSFNFKKRLDDTMADYGRQAQTLDQTFPQRLISTTEPLTPDELRQRMTALDQKTKDFMGIGILEETPAPPFDTDRLREMDPTEARVMTLHLQDTEHKLEALERLASRTRLLLKSVNGKFQNKQIHVDRENGLVAEDKDGKRLPLDLLSSGEQHELVLHYDLLFRVRPNTAVLIDEPELSLHVGWQKKFLPDLAEIVQLSGFDAVVATHSPFIVGDRDDLMVALGD